jgi:translation elongation factor EF-Tu-like GTPase
MNMVKADFRARVKFLSAEEGGRKTVATAEFLTPLLQFGGEWWSSRMWIAPVRPVKPGDTVEVDISVLRADLILAYLHVGDSFNLREGRKIADGEVLEIFPEGKPIEQSSDA